MARLILEEDGKTRRFQLSSGKLTFGSSERATLKLASDDIAELHGQIEMGSDGAVLRTANGVTQAKVAGRPVSGAHTLREGQPVQVGSARFSIEYDEGEGPRPPGAPRAVAGASATRAGAGSSRSGAGVTRRRPKAKKSLVPSWLIVVVVVAGAGFVANSLLQKTSKNLSGAEFDFDTRWNRYQREKTEDQIGARTLLNEISREELTAQQRALVDSELAQANEQLADIDVDLRNQKAMKWFSPRLESYFDKWPVTKERPHARLFMKRASWFESEYPTHPELDRVRRWMDRVRPVAELGSPMELEDLRVDVWGSTAAEPKDYQEALDAIDEFLKTAEGGDRTGAEEIRRTTIDEERAYYDEKLADAAVVYDKSKYPDKFNPSTAIEDMVRLVIGLRTEELRSDAARRLLAIPEFTAGMMKDYKRSQPHRFEKMVTEPSIRDFARANGLL